jgi:hypothetical protein
MSNEKDNLRKIRNAKWNFVAVSVVVVFCSFSSTTAIINGRPYLGIANAALMLINMITLSCISHRIKELKAELPMFDFERKPNN